MEMNQNKIESFKKDMLIARLELLIYPEYLDELS
jgi:hypothetical protein